MLRIEIPYGQDSDAQLDRIIEIAERVFGWSWLVVLLLPRLPQGATVRTGIHQAANERRNNGVTAG